MLMDRGRPVRLALGTDSQCYGIELDDHRAEQAQQQLYRVGFGSFFGLQYQPRSFFRPVS